MTATARPEPADGPPDTRRAAPSRLHAARPTLEQPLSVATDRAPARRPSAPASPTPPRT